MFFWENIQVGDPIVDDSNFTTGFRDDFDGPLDIETDSAPGNRSGKWKAGYMHANIDTISFAYGSDENLNPNRTGDNFVHNGINSETQVYPDTRKPHPSGWSPFSTANGVLEITSRPVDQNDAAEVDWARVKITPKDANGQDLTLSYNHPAKYVSGMLSTFGRFSCSFFRLRGRVKSPYGADGSSADFNQRSAVFPAPLWTLQDVPYGMDINGDPLNNGTQTYGPARPNGSGTFYEADADESFGESATRIHQTLHRHPPGTIRGNSTNESAAIPIGKDLRSDWRITGMDFFPDRVCYFVDGVYKRIVMNSDEIYNGLPRYAVDPTYPNLPVRPTETTAQQVGRQQHHDGSTRYMKHCLICNLARDGAWPRNQARNWVLGNFQPPLPPHQDTVSMEMDWVEIMPLVTDNPDQWPISRNGVLEALDGSTYIPPTPSPDDGTPSVPQNLVVTTSASGNVLTWDASTDDVAVTGYNVFRDGQYLASVGPTENTGWTDTASTSTTAVYTVGAYDGALPNNNLSALSAGASSSGTTTAPPATGTTGSYAPTLGFGIRYRQGMTSGEAVYYLEYPAAVGPGTWDLSEFGADATVISDDLRSDNVRVSLPSVNTATSRVIRFIPD